MDDILKQMSELAAERNRLQGAWNRHILTIASGGFALLVGLKPEVPTDTAGRWLLAAAWAFLGTGILSGAAATRAEANLAGNLARTLHSRLQRRMAEGTPLSELSKDGPLSARASWIFRISGDAMVWSLTLAVAAFVAYSIRQILTA